MSFSREALGELAKSLVAVRDADEDHLIVSFGAHGPSTDCRNGHMSVTVQRDGESATGEAVHLQDALLIARAAVNRQIAAREKKREEAKALPLNNLSGEE